MIPILYSNTEVDYTHNGIAPLKESIEAVVTEEANGLLELYLEYPIQGMWSSEIKDQMFIKAKPNDIDEPHVFRIYEIIKNMEEQMLFVYASSITNDLGLDLVQSATVKGANGQQAMDAIKHNLTQGSKLTLGSDITTKSSTTWSMRNPLNCIVGEEGSIVHFWGGELKRNNKGLYLYTRRGRDNVAVIRQGKNLEGFDMTVSTKGLVTRILPYATIRNPDTGDESEIVGTIVNSPRINNYPVRSLVAIDYSDSEITNVAQLNAAAATYFTTSNPDIDKPTVRLKIDMLQLANTSYYAKFKKLESVGVFDTVTTYVPKFDVNVTVKIRQLEYDVLREKAVRVIAGDPVNDIFSDIRKDYSNAIDDKITHLDTIVQQASNGKNTIWRGVETPVEPHRIGDLWYKPVGEHMVMLQWDGLTWNEILNTEDMESVKREVDAAGAEAKAAKQAAEQSYTDSVAEAERLVQVQTDAFNSQMSDVNQEISTVKTNIDTAISNVNQEIANNFTSLSDTISEVDDIATQAQADADKALLDLKSKASTAALQAYSAATDAELALKASKEALEDGLALKVAVNTYNAKVTELNSLITAAQTKADKAAADLLKKADTTVVNAALAKKLATSTYNTKMASLDTAISGHSTRIKATEDGLALTATKTEVDAVRTRMSEAETEISQNSDAIALKASQSSLDTTNGKLATAEAALVVQAGEIASKVSQTDFDSLNGRVGTAETKISQQAGQIALKASQLDLDAATGDISDVKSSLTIQAGQIASKVSQTDFNALDGRVGTAESSISQQAGQIALRVTTATYNAGIGSKENTITKSNTAPSHLNGRLWLDTSVTPNVLKRSTGSAWVKVTPTTAGEVGAYSSSAGSALAGRVQTAETSIVSNTTAIGLRATKTDLDATNGRLTTAEGSIEVQAGQIASKVSQTDFNTLKGRVGTAESSITQQASQIASKVSQTDFDALDGRMDTAESSITQNAGAIALRVTTTTYNAGIGSKENTITKATTAPAHLNGRLWLDTSVTPNVLKRSTGTAWVKVTPTTPGEVGAYSAGAGSALAGRVTTAETSITANTTAIGLRATKTDLDATKGRLTTAEGSISVQAGQIALKANQTTVDTLTGRVKTAETSISANTTAINLRATKSSVDTLTGRVTTAEGSITTQAGQIALKANTTTVNALTGRVSTAETNISANTKAINLRATKTELTNAINDIEVGGRNLLKRTSSEWTKMSMSEGGWNVTAGAASFKELGLSVGDSYSVQMELKVPTGQKCRLRVEEYKSSSERESTYSEDVAGGTSKRVWITSKLKADRPNMNIYINPNPSPATATYNVEFRFLKVEKGTKATDWSPAQEDVDAAISTVQANLTVEAGKITALTTRVSGSETNISNVTQTVSGINTTISTLRTDVNGKATTVALNAVKSTADGNKTTISNHAGRLTTVETNVNGLQTTVSNKADKSQITQLTTSISTKVESATYNTKMTQLDNAINLRVVQGDVTAAILADKKIKDTRATNQLPSWYYSTYPSQRVEEFKQRTTIGVPGSSTYAKLVTDVPWSSSSGGVVVQTAYSSDGVYNRSGNSAGTAWGGWVKQTDSANVLAQINLSSEGVLIQGKRIQLDGDVTMTAAYVTKLNTQTLSAITANITSIRSQVLITDSVTSTHIKAESALIDSLFATTALITRLTSKAAFITNIKAITISADKVTTGTLNAADVNIINLNVSKIVGLNSTFIQSQWNLLDATTSITGTGLVSQQGALSTRLTGGEIATVSGTKTGKINALGMEIYDSSNGQTTRLHSDGLEFNWYGIKRVFEQNSEGVTIRPITGSGNRLNSSLHITTGPGTDKVAYVEFTNATSGNGGRIILQGLDMGVRHPAGGVVQIANYANDGRLGNLRAGTFQTSTYDGRGLRIVESQINTLADNQTIFLMPSGTGELRVGTGGGAPTLWPVRASRFVEGSSRASKTNINPYVGSALDEIKNLQAVTFNRKEDVANGIVYTSLGFIAEDSPFIAIKHPDAPLGVDHYKMVTLAIKGVQELTDITDEHASDILRVDTYVTQHELEIKNLKERIKQLEEKLA